MPAGADDRAVWSLLVGYFSSFSLGESLLRLHRFRVARSGRVLGRSSDALEIWDDVDYDYEAKDASSHVSSARATPGPDGRSLCLFCREIWLDDLDHIVSARPLQLNLNLGAADDDRGITVSPLPGLPPELKPGMPTRPISAAGHLWAPYLTITKHYDPSRLEMLRLRLDKDDGLWVEVASIDLPRRKDQGSLAGRRVLQGYAVVGSTILLDCRCNRLTASSPSIAPPTPWLPLPPPRRAGTPVTPQFMSVVFQGNNGSKHEMFVPEHVNILHSTCPQLDMSPSKPNDISEFCFLQRILNGISYCHSLVLDDSAIQINKALYIICQVASRSTVYKITISDGRLGCQGKTLTQSHHIALWTRDGRFAAYEITEQGDSYYLGDEISRPFSWRIFWEIDRTCFDYVGKDTISGAIMFYVVQGGDYNRRGGSPDKLFITTVQVKTERTYNGFKKDLDQLLFRTPGEKGHQPATRKGLPRRRMQSHFMGKKEVTTMRVAMAGACRRTLILPEMPTFKIFCKSESDEGCCLALRDGTLVPADSPDEHQHWFRDTRLSIAMKDEEGNPVFSLVNKATNLAIKHSLGMNHPVRLAKFNPDNYDESLLWTESCDLGKDFGYIRMVHDISLGLDAIRAGGGVHMPDTDSTTVVLSKRAESDTQSWKILYWDDEANATCGGLYAMPTCRIHNKGGEGFSLAVRDGAVCLVPSNPADKYQHWIKDTRYGNRIKDEEGYLGFALINRFSGEAIKFFSGLTDQGFLFLLVYYVPKVKLVPYNPNYVDKSVLWTESCDVEHGFRCIRPLDSINLNFHVFLDDKDHGTNVALRHWSECDNQCWNSQALVRV
ncbi:unnamed protein product [Miscanthus lutarioriparius]|uniref:Uncharacterized protein n=1 Tax=Miscanthus lutarioriparius TaxID=422564 RepID=A0A811SM26_9POAL|nr:unnamed protein product [Miscanthus lutarioriparius]